MKKITLFFVLITAFSSCKKQSENSISTIKKVKIKPVYQFGYKLNDFLVIRDTIKNGESFGAILDRHHVFYPKINKIAVSIKEIFDVRRVRAGKPYTILASKDSTEKALILL